MALLGSSGAPPSMDSKGRGRCDVEGRREARGDIACASASVGSGTGHSTGSARYLRRQTKDRSRAQRSMRHDINAREAHRGACGPSLLARALRLTRPRDQAAQAALDYKCARLAPPDPTLQGPPREH